MFCRTRDLRTQPIVLRTKCSENARGYVLRTLCSENAVFPRTPKGKQGKVKGWAVSTMEGQGRTLQTVFWVQKGFKKVFTRGREL